MCFGAPPAAVNSFITYHRRIGFERIFMYLDSVSDEYLETLGLEPSHGLVVHRCDAAFWQTRFAESVMVARRSEHKVFDDVARCWETEVQSRQSLVVEHAIALASRGGLEWLLHIDVDEAFLPGRLAPPAFFAALPSEAQQVFFSNLEGVPESELTLDWMREVHRFKINPAFASDRAAVEAAWQHVERARRVACPQVKPSSYFIAYVSGKSAIRLPGRDAAPGSLPLPFDVHKFLVPSPGGAWKAPVTVACSEHLDTRDAPTVLHYPSCGYETRYSRQVLGARCVR